LQRCLSEPGLLEIRRPEVDSHACWLIGRGITRAEDDQGTPTQVYTSPRIQVYEEQVRQLLLWKRSFNSAEAEPEVSASSSNEIMSYRGTALIRKCVFLGPYGRTMPRLLWRSWEGGRSLFGEVPL